jgi:hypothetical protein
MRDDERHRLNHEEREAREGRPGTDIRRATAEGYGEDRRRVIKRKRREGSKRQKDAKQV